MCSHVFHYVIKRTGIMIFFVVNGTTGILKIDWHDIYGLITNFVA